MELLIIKILLAVAIFNSFFKPKNNLLFCGLVGFSGEWDYDPFKIKMLMLLNGARGRDSAGFYTVNKKLKCIYERSEKSIDDELIYNKDIDKGHSIFIGHCRAKSYGIVKKENAHPFWEQYKENNPVILAHNGTLTNLYHLKEHLNTNSDDKNYFTSAKIDVDSQIFPMYFSKYGIEDTGILSKIEGGASILYTTNQNYNVLYAYTNGERPLHYGYIDNNMYISSEAKHLELIGCSEVKSFEKNVSYKIRNGIILEQTKITVNPIKAPVHTHHSSHNNSSNKYGYGSAFNRSSTTVDDADDFSKLKDKRKEDIINFLNSNPDRAVLDYSPRTVKDIDMDKKDQSFIISFSNGLTEHHTAIGNANYFEDEIVHISFTSISFGNKELLVQESLYNTGTIKQYFVKNIKELDLLIDDSETEEYQIDYVEVKRIFKTIADDLDIILKDDGDNLDDYTKVRITNLKSYFNRKSSADFPNSSINYKLICDSRILIFKFLSTLDNQVIMHRIMEDLTELIKTIYNDDVFV